MHGLCFGQEPAALLILFGNEGAIRMKSMISQTRTVAFSIFMAILCLAALPWLSPSRAEAAAAAGAVVGAIEGEAEVSGDSGQEIEKLASGSAINPGDAVFTEEKSKLLLRWDSGLMGSLGAFSSILLLPEDVGGPATNIQMTDGIFRLSVDPRGGSRPTPYSVTTAVASIQPESSDQPVDFIVESYDPSSTVITVVAGRVKVRNLTVSPAQEQIISSCQNVYIEEGKGKPEPLSVSPEDLKRLADASTIGGTIAANLDACGAAVSTLPPPVEAPMGPPPRYAVPPEEGMYGYSYPSMPDYYVEDWDVDDIYPYPEIRVMPPPEPGGEIVVVMPGYGSLYVDLPVYDGWVFDPGIVQIYAGTIFLERIVFFDRHFLRDCRLRQRELNNLIYLAQATGNRNLLLDARRELDYLNVRANWASRRIHRLESKVAALQSDQRKFAGKLPRGLNLHDAISNSFNSPRNLPVVQKFQDRVKTELAVQNQLANVAGQEVAKLRARVAQERNPEKRLALRSDMDRIRADLAAGRLPLSVRQKDVQGLIKGLSQERDVDKRQKLETELLGQLRKSGAQFPAGALSPDKLAGLKQDLAKYPNVAQRQDLEKRFAELQQSADVRRQVESNTNKIEEITAQAVKEKDSQKQRELLGQMNQLLKSPAAAGIGAAGLQFFQQRQNLERQISGEQDKQKQETLQRSLEELKKKEADANLKQQEELRKVQERDKAFQQRLKQQKDLKEQTEIKRRQLGEPGTGVEEKRKQQLDLQKQTDLERQKQLQQQKLEQERLQQQLPLKPLDQRRLRQQELRKQKLEQEQTQKELLRKKKFEQDQTRQQQLQQKQLEQDQLRKQKLEKERGVQDQLRKQQLEQQQLRKQQQGQEQLKQQQLQQEQMRQKQLQQQQIQKQQQQQQLQQEQLRKQQLQQQQLQQQKLQQEQLRKQQLQQQQIQQQQLQQQQQQQQQLRQQQLQQQQLQQQQLQQQRQQQLQQQQLRQQQLQKELEEKAKLKK
jgi:hypothetical protein